MAVTINEADLKKDIDLYLHTYCNAVAKFAREEMSKYASEAIHIFYNSYTPKVYDRTFDLRDNAFVPFYMNNGWYRKVAHSYVGGVQFNSANMQPYKQHPASKVLEQALYGMHGFRAHTTPEPLDYVLRARDHMLAHGYIYEQAHAAAKSKSYRILKV